MQRTRLARIVVSLILAAVASGCRLEPTTDGPPPAIAAAQATVPRPSAADDLPDPAGLGPEELVEAFFRWYAEYPGHPIRDGALAGTGYLTDDYPARLEEIVAGYDLGSADPILCAQDYPSSIRAHPAVVTGDEAVLHVTSSFPNHRLEVHLRLVEGQWRIRQVYCAPRELEFVPTPIPQPTITLIPAAGEADAGLTADWPTYRNDAFGFALQLPPDWVYRVFVATPDQPPLGPENIRMHLHLMPAEWAAQQPLPSGPGITPFIVEVSEGSLEAFRQANMEPAESAVLDIGGLAVVWEREAVTDELSLERYIFQHPRNEALRVTFHDPVSGFPERLAAHGWTLDTFKTIMTTFTFFR
ncbi:MAG: hypothetical protein GX649_08640 [Chloroflexi bacterium]|nr:hypothetical protein [Chloroflexota bacterium]